MASPNTLLTLSTFKRCSEWYRGTYIPNRFAEHIQHESLLEGYSDLPVHVQVVQASGQHDTRMQDLNLSANYLDAAMLPAYSSGMSHTQQYSAWNAPIQAAFARLQGLTLLDLSCNNLTSSNIHTLLDCHTNTELGALTGGMKPGAVNLEPAVRAEGSTSAGESEDSRVYTGSGALGSVFQDRLQSLNISGNTLTPPAPLVDTLQRLTALTRLNVADTALRTADMQELAPALICMTAMRWLSIGSNRITQRAAGALRRALALMPDLERLDASGHIMFQFGATGERSYASPPHMHAHGTTDSNCYSMHTA